MCEFSISGRDSILPKRGTEFVHALVVELDSSPPILCKARIKTIKITSSQTVLSKYQKEKNMSLYKFCFNLYFNGHLQQVIRIC